MKKQTLSQDSFVTSSFTSTLTLTETRGLGVHIFCAILHTIIA